MLEYTVQEQIWVWKIFALHLETFYVDKLIIKRKTVSALFADGGKCLYGTEHLLYCIRHIGHGIVGMHSLIQGYHVPQNREKGINALCVAATASLTTQPEKQVPVFIFLAILATPMGAFPITVWPSRRPSPVITTSASRIYFSRWVSSRMIVGRWWFFLEKHWKTGWNEQDVCGRLPCMTALRYEPCKKRAKQHRLCASSHDVFHSISACS